MELDFNRMRAAAVADAPYPYFVVRNLLEGRDVAAVIRDYPVLEASGLFLAESTSFGPAFGALLQALEAPALTDLVGSKLGLDLTDRPTLITVRDRAAAKDGQIHADSHFKLATMLLYLNEDWAPMEGRLRVLRSGTDLDDYAAEVAPEGGLAVFFRVQANSWHGHKPFEGPRRYVMVNWCTSRATRDREAAKHWMSGKLKFAKRLLAGAS